MSPFAAAQPPSVRPAPVLATERADRWRCGPQRALHPANGPLVEAELIEAIATGLAAVTVPWELLADEALVERRYERILSTERYEAWVIFWPQDGALDLHDHGGSAGAFSVVAGSLDEVRVGATGRQVRRRIRAGSTVSFAAGQVHGVTNRSVAPATSVHVYSPPLRTMRFYGPGADGRLVVTREDAPEHDGWN